MTDRSQAFVSVVAAVLCVAALVAAIRLGIRRLGRRPPGLVSADWRRWFGAGLDRMRLIAPALLALAIGVGVSAAITTWNVRTASRLPPDDPRRAAFFARPHLGSAAGELRWLAWSGLVGGGHILPETQVAFLIVLPLILGTRPGRRFPWSRGSSTARYWWVNAWAAWILMVLGWATSLIPSARRFLETNLTGPEFPMAVILVVFLLWGYGFVLPPLLAALDERTDGNLSARTTSPVRVFCSLTVLQVVLVLGSSLESSVTYFRHLVGVTLPWGILRAISQSSGFLAVVLPPLLLTTALSICCTASIREALSQTLAWWKRQFIALILLSLAAGLAAALTSFVLRGIFGQLPNEAGFAIAFETLRAEALLAVSLLAFCLLLGAWLEGRDRMEAAAPI